MRAFLSQTKAELLLTLRRPESVLVTMIIPAGLLLFFSLVRVLPTQGVDLVDFLLPGAFSIAIMATAMVGLGIATGYERRYRILKRLGGTPLGRGRLLLAKASSVLVMEALQAILLMGIAVALLDWEPRIQPAAIAVTTALGTLAFAGMGLFFAGSLRAEANLAVTNGLFLAFVLLGGSMVPLRELPGSLRAIAGALPAAPLASSIRWALEGGRVPTGALELLTLWAIATPILASLTFSWE